MNDVHSRVNGKEREKEREPKHQKREESRSFLIRKFTLLNHYYYYCIRY